MSRERCPARWARAHDATRGDSWSLREGAQRAPQLALALVMSSSSPPATRATPVDARLAPARLDATPFAGAPCRARRDSEMSDPVALARRHFCSCRAVAIRTSGSSTTDRRATLPPLARTTSSPADGTSGTRGTRARAARYDSGGPAIRYRTSADPLARAGLRARRRAESGGLRGAARRTHAQR